MQTRRDQLQAYRFQNRRALAALVTGEPNVIEPPMRRLTVLTVSGIMIAVLIAVGFALLGVFKPTSGDSWKDPGTVIVESETGANYVLLDGTLHPVLNYASAVLAAANKQSPKVVTVDRGDLGDTPRGPTIGIVGLPDSLPDASNLTSYPWTVCSRKQGNGNGSPIARVSVTAGGTADAQTLGRDAVFVTDTNTAKTPYLLAGGTRYEIASADVATALNITGRSALQVGTAFLQGLPAGPDLRAPRVPGVGKASTQVRFQNRPATVGALAHTTDTNQDFVVLDDGVQPLPSKLWVELFRALRGAGGQPIPAIATTFSEVSAQPQTPASWAAVRDQLSGLPADVPALTNAPYNNHGVCAIYRNSSSAPGLAVPPKTNLPAFNAGGAVQSEQSAKGLADSVSVTPGRAALVTSGNSFATVFLVAAPGKRFPFVSRDTLALFGYGSVKPTAIPKQMLSLVPQGPVLDPTAARTPQGG